MFGLGMVYMSMADVLHQTVQAVRQNRLYRCLTCEAVSLHNVEDSWFKPTGALYQLAVKTNGKLDEMKRYTFPAQGMHSVITPVKGSILDCFSNVH